MTDKTARHYSVLAYTTVGDEDVELTMSTSATLQAALEYRDLHGLTAVDAEVWVTFTDGTIEQVA